MSTNQQRRDDINLDDKVIRHYLSVQPDYLFSTLWPRYLCLPQYSLYLHLVIAGTTMVWLGSYGTSQTEVQRFCSVSTLKKARLALYCNIPGVMFNISLGCLAGW